MSDRMRIQRRKQISDNYSSPHLVQTTGNLRMGSAQASVNHDISRISLQPQARLTVSQPGDFYEQEADRVANEVMRMQTPESNEALVMRSSLDTIYRKCSTCQKDEDFMRKLSKAGGLDEGAIAQVHQTVQSGGQPLDRATRNFMELRFGHDFSPVRIYADSQAAESARAIRYNEWTTW